MLIIKLLALVGAWLFFYHVLKSRNKMLPGIKATVITLLFASLIFRFSTDIYTNIDRGLFVFNKNGEVLLIDSPLRIPANKDATYCNQFTDQNKKPIQKISVRNDGKYCGEFWKFETDDNLVLPYKTINSNQILYWASPSLQITGSRESLERR